MFVEWVFLLNIIYGVVRWNGLIFGNVNIVMFKVKFY